MKEHEIEIKNLIQVLSSEISITLSEVFEKVFPIYHEEFFREEQLDSVEIMLEDMFGNVEQGSVLNDLRNGMHEAEKFIREKEITLDQFMQSYRVIGSRC
ncbi:MAG: hypothetical protein K0S71_656 [Clostridia bacterium]|jgi:hypothetical protein|nr:hypothetical protein [Clostridia bacterium]